MSKSRLGVRITGFCALVLGLLAVNAGAAQAEAGSKWLILTSGGVVKTTEELPATLAAEMEGGKEALLTKILGIKVEKNCKTLEVIGAKVEGEDKISSGAKVKFTGCKLFLNGKESPECTPHTGAAPEGTLETNKLRGDLGLHPLKNEKGEFIKNEKGEIILHGPIRLEPEVGMVFMTLEMKESCPIGLKIPLLGTLYAKDCENKLETHLAQHLIEEGPGSSVWVISKTEEHKVILDGSLLMFLTGPHLSLKWAGMIG